VAQESTDAFFSMSWLTIICKGA